MKTLMGLKTFFDNLLDIEEKSMKSINFGNSNNINMNNMNNSSNSSKNSNDFFISKVILPYIKINL